MPCYATNPLLLLISDCRRTVCIHCRTGIRLSAAQRENGAWYEEMRGEVSQGMAPGYAPGADRLPAERQGGR